MGFFRAKNFAQIPVIYKEASDFILVEQDVDYKTYPERRFKVMKQKAFDVTDAFVAAEGDQTYEGNLTKNLVPGSVKFKSQVGDTADPTDVIVNDLGKDFIAIGDPEGAGHVLVASAEAGTFGYTLVVKVGDSTDVEASLVGQTLTVDLAIDDAIQSSAEIGDSTRSNEMVIKFVESGEYGNDYEVEIVSDNEVVRPMSVEFDDDNQVLFIHLATGSVADDDAEATVGEGDNGEVTAKVAGIAGNDYTLSVDASLDEVRALSASLTGEDDKDIVVLLAVEADDPAYLEFGEGDNGVVTVSSPGLAGNDYMVSVDAFLSELRDLSATIDDKHVEVLLATEPYGQAQAIIETSTEGEGDTPAITVSATEGGDFDGTAGNGVEVVFIDDGTEGTVAATYDEGTNTIIVNFRGKADETADNIASAIDGITGFDSEQASGGNFTSAADADVTTGILAGGTNQLYDAGNSATLVAAEIDGLSGVGAVASGTGGDPITAGITEESLFGGTNALETAANTATLVAGVVNGLDGVTGEASGNGTASIDESEGPIPLEGGTNLLDASANTVTLVSAAIEDILDDDDNQIFETDFDGADGGNSYVAADVGIFNFEDGYDGGELDDDKNTVTAVAAAIDALDEFDASAEDDGTVVIDADDLVDGKLFSTFLLRETTPAGTLDRNTGEYEDLDFGANTISPVTVDISYKKFNLYGIDHPTRFAERNPQYVVTYVDLRGEGKCYNYK